jgi:hypothetical protein
MVMLMSDGTSLASMGAEIMAKFREAFPDV